MMRNIKIGTALGAMLLFLPLVTLAAEADIEGFEFECRFSDGTVLKPKFGDIKGVFYTDLPAQRKQIGLITTGVGHPSQQLIAHANFHRHIRKRVLQNNQLPSPVPGTNLTKPVNW